MTPGKCWDCSFGRTLLITFPSVPKNPSISSISNDHTVDGTLNAKLRGESLKANTGWMRARATGSLGGKFRKYFYPGEIWEFFRTPGFFIVCIIR